jgi:hypothetical protein
VSTTSVIKQVNYLKFNPVTSYSRQKHLDLTTEIVEVWQWINTRILLTNDLSKNLDSSRPMGKESVDLFYQERPISIGIDKFIPDKTNRTR